MEEIFPLITVRRKSTDPPWYNWKVRKRIAQKRGIYKREARSVKWRRVRKLLEALVEGRRAKYGGSQSDVLLASDGERSFFKNVKNYGAHDKQEQFDVCTLFPRKSEQEVADELIFFFHLWRSPAPCR